MSLPRTIIGDALDAAGIVGLGQIPPAADVDKAFRYLDQIASQWSRRQWLPTIPETGFVDLDTDIGLTPDFDAALTYALAVRLRPAYQLPPDEALQALLADAVEVIRKDNTETTAGSTPRHLIRLALLAAGAIKPGQVAPVADIAEAYTLLQQLAAQWARRQYLALDYVLPAIDAATGLGPEFNAALIDHLAVRLRSNYAMPPDQALTAQAENALTIIRKTNVQPAATGTPRDIIALALKASGAIKTGQIAPVADTADAYTLLQQIVAQWARKRWLVPHLADVAVPLTGAASYTIGLGGDVNMPRPDRIEAAFYRTNPTWQNPIDYPLDVIDNREDWNLVSMKSLRSLPAAVFYDTAYPFGVLYVYPAPPLGSLSYELHLSVKAGVGAFAGLDIATSLPPEYDAALVYTLAARLRPHYGLPPDPTIMAMAADALNTIRRANTQIATLRMPAGLPGLRGRGLGWQAGLGGMGAPPGFNTAQGFRVGISTLGGTDIVK